MYFQSYQLFGVVEYLFIKYSQLNELDQRLLNIQIVDRKGVDRIWDSHKMNLY